MRTNWLVLTTSKHLILKIHSVTFGIVDEVTCWRHNGHWFLPYRFTNTMNDHFCILKNQMQKLLLGNSFFFFAMVPSPRQATKHTHLFQSTNQIAEKQFKLKAANNLHQINKLLNCCFECL